MLTSTTLGWFLVNRSQRKRTSKSSPASNASKHKKIYFWHNLKAYHNILSSNEKLKQWESLSYSYWTQLIKAKKIIDYKSKLPNVHYFLLYQDIFTKWNQLLNIQFLSGDILL